MAWTTPRTWVTGEVVTAALLNAQIKGNSDLAAAAIMTAAGDIIYASGANTPARVAKGTNGNIIHQASCAPAWTASPSITGITLSGTLDANGTVDADVTDFDVLSSGDIDLVSSANAAAAVYIAQSTGTSGTIKIHADTGTSVTEGAESINILSDVGGVGIRSTANLAKAVNITSDGGSTGSIAIFNDQGTSVTEGAESISLLSDAGGVGIRSTANLANAVNITADGGSTSTIQIYNDQGTSVTEGAASVAIVSDAGGVELRSTANLANAINITNDGGTTGTISIFNDLGSSVTEGAESISLLSDAGGVGIRSTANLANAVNITADGGTTSTIQIFNDQGTAVNEGVASIQLLSDVGGIGIKSGLNAAGAIRLTADAGTSETIMIHADQGSGTGSICLTSDAGGITLNPGTFVSVGGIADGEIRIFEDTGAGCNYAAIKVQNMAASYTLTLPADDGCCGEVLTTNGSGTLTWGAAGGFNSCADTIINNGYGIVIGHCAVLVAADHPGNTVGEFTMIGAAGGDTGIHVIRHAADAGGGAIRFAKSRNATVGSHTIVQSGDTLGEISFFGCDGGDFQPFGARIKVLVDGTPGTGDMPGRMEFSTTADGAESPTLAMTINKSQQAEFAAGATCKPSIKFICGSGYESGFYLPGGNNIRAVTNSIAMWNIHEANGGWNIEFGDTSCGDGDRSMSLNQGCKDNAIFTLKSSDVAHGVTGNAETDTYLRVQKRSAAGGGAGFFTFNEDGGGAQSFYVEAIGGQSCATHGVGGNSTIHFRAYENCGGSGVAMNNADANIFSVSCGGNMRFGVDAGGNIYSDLAASVYDTYCDPQLIRALDTTLSIGNNPRNGNLAIRSRWDEFVQYNEQDLIDAKILGAPVSGVPESERGLVNITQLLLLHNGGIWQLHSKLNDQAEELTALKGQLTALTEGK